MPESNQLFPTTSSTLLVLLQSPDPRDREIGVARFCSLYYPAIYGYARALGLKEPDAQDRVQDFFVEVVRDALLEKFDPKRESRLSAWLMRCFRNMVSNQRAAQNARKRGGGREFVEFDPEYAEHSYRAAHLAQLAPEPTFDLMLAREVWQAAKVKLLQIYERKGQREFITDLLPITLLEQWPPRPMPTQEEMARRHATTPVRLKAFFNRTLKVQAKRAFGTECAADSPGITEGDVDHLWSLLCRYGAD